jgi:glycosyltransferase involved in cell wall biosynthesis
VIFSQVIPYVRFRNSFTFADQWGAQVAHHELLLAVARHSMEIERIDLFLEGFAPGQRHHTAAALEELKGEHLPREITLQSTRRIGELIRKDQRIFMMGNVDFLQLSQIRLAAGGQGFPICCLLHSIDSPTMLGLYAAAALSALESDVIVATSKAGVRAVESLLANARELLRMRGGIPTGQAPSIHLIPLGVDTEFMRPHDRMESRDLLGLPRDATLILYVGRLAEDQKADLDPLLLAFERLHKKHPKTHLVLAGQDTSGNYTRVLAQRASALAIRENVSFIPNFPFFSKPLIYSACDLLASPVDNVQETFGLSVLEALSCGIPAVVSDWSGYRDIVQHGENGLLVRTMWNPHAADDLSGFFPLCEPSISRHYLAQRTVVDWQQLEAHLELLVTHPELRQQMGQNGRKAAEAHFSWRVVVSQYDALWREQWNILRKQCRDESSFQLNYNAVFGSFATQNLDESEPLFVTEAGSAASGNPNMVRQILPEGFNSADVLSVLQYCSSNGPLDMAAVVNKFGRDAIDAIAWLLKKGFLGSRNAVSNSPNESAAFVEVG